MTQCKVTRVLEGDDARQGPGDNGGVTVETVEVQVRKGLVARMHAQQVMRVQRWWRMGMSAKRQQWGGQWCVCVRVCV